jgi:hypothetical protein
VGELKTRFGIEAVAVTSGSAARLERSLPLAQTLFDAHPFTVVSLDYIKAEKRRENERMAEVQDRFANGGSSKAQRKM